MSGLAGVVFSFWTALADPQNAKLKHGLWLTAAICLFISSYRVWGSERKQLEQLQNESEKEIRQMIREFEEIKTSLLTSGIDFIVSRELQRLKLFLHKHLFLLNRTDVREFYLKWILPHELPLQVGAALSLTGSSWRELREDLLHIDLRLSPLTAELPASNTS